jgi:alpha-glucoside transport system substrate-binding protein
MGTLHTPKSGTGTLPHWEPNRPLVWEFVVPSFGSFQNLQTYSIVLGGTSATGWPFTHWNADLLLRLESAEYYDQWLNHEVPFNDAPIEDVWNEILGEWNKEGAVFAAGGSIAATNFGDNGQPLVDGDCYMHRQGDFFSGFLPEGTIFGPDDIDVFYFPSSSADSHPVLVFGTQAAAFRDAPEVWEVMKFLTSAEYANIRAAKQSERKGGGLSDFLSANTQADLGNWLPLEQSFIQILRTGDPARFDPTNLMPSEVGTGSFWTEATNAVNGDKSVTDALQAIEDSWPSG